MSGSGSYAVSRSRGGDRFYNPPPIRRHQQQQQLMLQQQQQQQLQKTVEAADNRTDSDDSVAALSKPPSVCPSSPPNVTNLDRLMESVTPSVQARHLSEVNSSSRGWRTREGELQHFYSLGDLWESFREWSVYGVGVPLLLDGKDLIRQYYVPFLSGIQLYVDSRKPPRIWRHGEESDAESARETSSCGSSDCEVDRRVKSVVDGPWSQHNAVNLNSQRLNKLSLRDKSLMSSSSDEAEVCNPPGLLVFEYLEREPPYNRKPLADKVSVLESEDPVLGMYRSCDILPSSWMSVAWYPIYRIPVGPTLQDLDASFLTFHSLSTCSRRTGNGQPQFHGASGWKVHAGVDSSSEISLPVFGLASYKLNGSILTPSGPIECEQEKSLLQAADNWLQRLQVVLPDYQFFRSHYYSHWRQ